MSYTRILLNSTNLNNDMFLKGLTESPNCECGKNRETIDHFLLECEMYKDQRKKMNMAISDMWFSKRSMGNLNLSKEMLAGPNFSSKINSKDDRMVKLAMFVNLQETKAI